MYHENLIIQMLVFCKSWFIFLMVTKIVVFYKLYFLMKIVAMASF